jgi:hypothetical protein
MRELRVERKENMAGGKGHVIIKHILEVQDVCRSHTGTGMFSWIS